MSAILFSSLLFCVALVHAVLFISLLSLSPSLVCNAVLFHAISFCSILLLYSITLFLFCLLLGAMQFYSMLFRSVSFHPILFYGTVMTASNPCCRDTPCSVPCTQNTPNSLWKVFLCVNRTLGDTDIRNPPSSPSRVSPRTNAASRKRLASSEDSLGEGEIGTPFPPVEESGPRSDFFFTALLVSIRRVWSPLHEKS